jgi:L-amino acid N-acyltransferase YncA
MLIFPLTTAAPAHVVDALELSGDAQGRALGAGLLAALIGSERLGAAA